MKILKRIIFIVVLISMSIALPFVGNGYDMYKQAIEQISVEDKIAEIKDKENYTNFSELPQMYKNAVIAVEDHRFYKHNGIDIIAIGRSAFNDIKAMSFVEGGSTITQQLAKNIYFTQEKKIERKIAEVFMAFEIEKNCDKDEILELYLNTSYFGDGYYTPKEACRGYFNKELNEMTDYECILLAGIPNAPSVYAPTKNPDLAKQRQRQVMKKMIEAELIQINLTDIKLDEMTLRLKGKGNKERIIYLNVATKEAIEKYLNVRTNLPKSNPDYNALFLSERNKRISKRMVQTIIGTELNTLFDNNSQGYHTHTLRHTSATLLYNENDIDIRIIQSMLGHSSLASTEIYAHVSNKKLKEFMQNFSILDIKK